MKTRLLVLAIIVIMVFSAGCFNSGQKEAEAALAEAQKAAAEAQKAAAELAKQNEDMKCSNGVQDAGEIGVDCGGACEACSAEPEPEKEQEQVQEQEQQQEESTAKYTIMPDQELLMLEKMKKSDPVLFYTNTNPKGLEVGEDVVYVFGITNTYTEPVKFRFKLSFNSAKNPSNNNIAGLDEDYILSWVEKNDLPDIESSEQYKQFVMPIGITAMKKISNSKDTVPGTYEFRVTVEYQKEGITTWKDHGWADFSTRVK